MARPPIFRLFPLLSGLWRVVGMLALLATGSSAAIDSVPAPADGIYDDTRALSEVGRRDLGGELRSLRDDLKANIWFTATSFTASGVTLRQQARMTRRRWSGESPALLIAYDRASNAVALSFSPDFWNRYPTPGLVELLRGAGRTIADTKLTLEERLTLIVQETGKRLRQLETVSIQQNMWFQNEEKRPVLLLAGGLLAAACLAAVAGMAARHWSGSSSSQAFFPEVVVGTRLGAPFGGGLIVEMDGDPVGRAG